MVKARLKILLSAYACEPGKGSEPGVGWNVAVHLARFHEVWVITRANNRPVIEAELSHTPIPRLHFAYFDLPRWLMFWKRGRSGIHLYYYLWQIGILRLARALHGRVGFDLVQHVSFVKYWAPSFLCLLPVPMIWGPVGGGESAPKTLWIDFGPCGMLYEATRETLRWLGEHDPCVRMTARRSAVALATTEETAKRLRGLEARRIERVSESGLSDFEIEWLGELRTRLRPPIRFLSIGSLLHLKGFHLGLAAFAKAGLRDSEYWVIGDGPQRGRLEALVRELGIANRVRFFGTLPRGEVFRRLEDCDVLVHPSLHDSGGWVCLEAMAARRPIICLDLGGPATQVTAATGFRISGGSRAQVVRDIGAAMRKLGLDHQLRLRMGAAAREHIVQDFQWERKIERLETIYAAALKKP